MNLSLLANWFLFDLRHNNAEPQKALALDRQQVDVVADGQNNKRTNCDCCENDHGPFCRMLHVVSRWRGNKQPCKQINNDDDGKKHAAFKNIVQPKSAILLQELRVPEFRLNAHEQQ